MCDLLENIATYYNCISSEGAVLREATQMRLEKNLWEMNRHFAALQTWAMDNNKRAWHCTPKLHFALHLALLSRSMNPRFAWTYGDEDFMGLVKRVGEACAAGTPAQRMVTTLCTKYAAGMDLSCAE